MSSRRFCFALCLFAFVSQVQPAHSQLSKGFQILVNRGLQLQGLCQDDCYVHLNTFTNANYTSFNWVNGVDGSGHAVHSSRPEWMGAAPGYPWARWAADETQMPPQATPYDGEEAPYMSQLLGIVLGDEWNLNDDATRTRLVNWFNSVRTNYPNSILYHNNYGSQVGDSQLADFYTRAQPDMLCFDTYPWQSVYDINQPNHTGPAIPGPPTGWYGDLRRYREHARGARIPLGLYRQTFHAVQDYDGHVFRDPSSSELRLLTFAGLAFNAKYFTDFIYNTGANSFFTNLFNGAGDTQTNNSGLFAELTDINKRAINFGKPLVQLTAITNEANVGYTSSILFIRGKDAGGSLTTVPVGFLPDSVDVTYTTWGFGRNDPYLTNGWAVTNLGTKNNGYPGDVIIAWFKVLDESFDGPGYTNEVYLMVVNGLTDPTGTAADCLQEIKLNFLNTFSAIEMLDPLTGNAQVQVLPVVNGKRQLVLDLNGGDAAFFKFFDGAPFVGVQVTGPPVIATQPASRIITNGTDTSFSVLAGGGLPLSYQWQFNGANISGATTNSFTRTNAQPADAGSYTVVVTNTSGSVTSTLATLTINYAPQIAAQPQNQTVNAGSNVLFSVVASANPPPTYRWRFNGTNIAGATTSSFTRTNAQSADMGSYSVLVSNVLGTLLSSNATLTVNGPPAITGQPQPQGVLAGGSASFSVVAVGVGPLAYQWRKDNVDLANGGNISGATNATVTVSNVQLVDLGSYAVVVKNGFGSITSAPAALAFATQPIIQTQPQSITTNAGSTATFTVTASGNGLAYQWLRSGTNLSDAGNTAGALTSALSLSTVTKPDAGSYSVVITNAAGGITSSLATLTVLYPLPFHEPFNYPVGSDLGGETSPDWLSWADVGTSTAGPYVTNQAGNLTVTNLAPASGNSIFFGGLGKSARLSFASPFASGTVYYSFALKVLDLTGASSSGGFLAGFNNSTGTQVTQPTAVGTRLYLRTTNGGFNLGLSKNSSTATDWVWDSTVYSTNQTIFVVGSYTFTSVANTTDDLSKMWINPNATNYGAPSTPSAPLFTFAGSDIASDQIASFVFLQRSSTLEPAAMIADELRIATNWAGVTPPVAPVITTQPLSRTNNVRTTASFSVGATGNFLTYQWRFNGTNISGATSSSYSLSNVQRTNAGAFTVVVSNVGGSATSSNALLTVNPITPLHLNSISALGDGTVQLQGSGDPGYFIIEGSSNLVNWFELTNILGSSGTFLYSDGISNAPQRFYRARLYP